MKLLQLIIHCKVSYTCELLRVQLQCKVIHSFIYSFLHQIFIMYLLCPLKGTPFLIWYSSASTERLWPIETGLEYLNKTSPKAWRRQQGNKYGVTCRLCVNEHVHTSVSVYICVHIHVYV